MTRPTTRWFPTRATADYLGIHERTLYRWRADQLLKPGTHFRKKTPAPNSPLLYDLEAVEQTMRELTARSPELLETA